MSAEGTTEALSFVNHYDALSEACSQAGGIVALINQAPDTAAPIRNSAWAAEIAIERAHENGRVLFEILCKKEKDLDKALRVIGGFMEREQQQAKKSTGKKARRRTA